MSGEGIEGAIIIQRGGGLYNKKESQDKNEETGEKGDLNVCYVDLRNDVTKLALRDTNLDDLHLVVSQR